MLQQPVARHAVTLIAGLSISVLGSCDDGPTSLAPEAAPGFVTVHTVASGRWIPEGDLQLSVDQDPTMVYELDLNGSIEFAVPPGDHVIELLRGGGEPFFPACGVEGGRTRSLRVESGKSASAQFELFCEVALELTASTGGAVPDPDGFRLLVGPPWVTDSDGGFPVHDLSYATVLHFDKDRFDSESPRWWSDFSPRTFVYTWGIAQNCTLMAPNPLILEVGGTYTRRELVSECVDEPSSTGTVYFLDWNAGQVFSIQADGSGLTQITSGPTIRHWSLSPDGSELVYTPWWDGGLFRMRLDGSPPVRITEDDGIRDEDVHWGVDGRILFATFIEGVLRSEIFSVLPDGSDLRQLTFDGGEQPRLSPDGSRVAYRRDGRLALMNPDGTGIVFTGPERSIVGPRWSPDGSALAALIQADDDFQHQIAIVDPDTGDHTFLTALPLQTPWAFAWSPDGQRLVHSAIQDGIDFPVDRTHRGDLFTISGGGQRLERLSTIDVEMRDLEWRN